MAEVVVTGDVEPIPLLRTSVKGAQDALLAGPHDLVTVHQVLAALADELAPISAHLEALAEEQPSGPVAAVLAHLRAAFTHAAGGRSEQTVRCVVTAAVTCFRLADDAALDAEAAEHAP